MANCVAGLSKMLQMAILTDGEKEVTPACVLSPGGLFIPMLNVL